MGNPGEGARKALVGPPPGQPKSGYAILQAGAIGAAGGSSAVIADHRADLDPPRSKRQTVDSPPKMRLLKGRLAYIRRSRNPAVCPFRRILEDRGLRAFVKPPHCGTTEPGREAIPA
ncbi:hypothetical protein GCM10027073_62620 [Streptomyces chlorus]